VFFPSLLVEEGPRIGINRFANNTVDYVGCRECATLHSDDAVTSEGRMEIDVIEKLREAFPDLDAEALGELSGLVRTKTYPPEILICKEGAFEDVFYLIIEGEVAITKHLEGDEERVLRHSVAGDFFGEMALIQDEPRSANVRTVKDTTVLEFDREVFEHLMASSPNLAWRMVRTTFDRLRSNDQTALADLREAYQTLARLDQAKLDFIEIAAHELRTPLTVIQGYADVLRNNQTIQDDAVLSEIVSGIVRGTGRLYEIVNGMLDISKIDTETLKVSRVPVLLQSVFTELKNEFSEVLTERRLSFLIKQIGDVPYIEADPSLVYKIFYQLYTNAIKYTPDGGKITTTYWLTDVEGIGPSVAVVVQDTGIGIDPKHHKVIFEKFYQIGEVALHSSSKTSFKGGGPGLGLALVKGAVEAHGGMVWVESEAHDEKHLPGSAFKVLLPVRAPQAVSATS
jgi:signal transduction histidine kinase